MLQTVLSKYGVAFHVALICLLAFISFLTGSPRGLPYIWLSLMLLECSFWMPSVRSGEDFQDARKRVAGSLIWDPLFYIGIIVGCLLLIQALNGGCSLKYLPDADIWKMGDPPQPWLPFAVRPASAVYWFSVLLAVFSVVLVVRNVLGASAKRVALRLTACFSGVCAIAGSIYALQVPEADTAAFFNSQVVHAAGLNFAFWSLIGIGLFADDAAHKKETGLWSYVVGGFCNFFGMLIYAEPMVMAISSILFLIVLIVSLVSLRWSIAMGQVLKHIVVGIILIGAIAGSLFYVFRTNPVTRKIETLKSFDTYVATYTATRPQRAKAAISVFMDHAWCGVGVEGYGEFVGFFVKSDAEWKAFKQEKPFVLNDYLQLLAEGGVLGVTLALAMLVVLLMPLFVHQRERMILDQEAKRAVANHTHGPSKERADPVSPVVTAGVFGVCLLGVAGGFGSPLRFPAVLISLAFVLAELPAFLPSAKRGKSAGRSR